MKSTKALYLLLITIILSIACKKQLSLPDPSFKVEGYEVKNAVNSDGDPVKSVAFKLSGNASIISFYSGLRNNDYSFKSGRILQLKGIKTSFSTTVENGTQNNQLAVLVSTDFNGTYDIDNIRAATWTDITDRYTYNNVGVTTALTSGVADIKDLNRDGKPIYYAFKYISRPQTSNGQSATWKISAFSMQAETEIGTTALATATTVGWKAFNYGNIDASRGATVTASTGLITFTGNNINKDVQTESWVVSKGFTAGDTDLGPDRPVIVKSYVDEPLKTYVFDYTLPGTYKVAFVATNANPDDTKTVVRELEVIVP